MVVTASSPDPDAVTAPRGSIQIGRFLGVPVYLSASWLLIALFVTFAFADLFRQTVDGAVGATPYLLALAFAVLSALCVLVHELGHVVVALALGLKVRRVFIFLLGGVSDIHPEPTRAGQELVISAAGPVTSAGIAGLAWVAAIPTSDHSAIGVELQILIWSNLVIAVFNALPGLPLDGGRVLRAAVWGLSRSRLRGTILAAWGGRVVALCVAASGLLLQRGDWQLTSVLFSAALGAFLWTGASQSLAAARLTDRIPRLALRQLFRPAIWVTAETSVAQALQRLWETGMRAIVVVDGDGRPTGIVTEARVDRVPQSARAWTSVAEVSVPTSTDTALAVDLTGQELLEACRSRPRSEYLVVDGGWPIGVLSAVDIRGALSETPAAIRPAASIPE